MRKLIVLGPLLLYQPASADEALHQAYLACERHINTCHIGEICSSVCATRPLALYPCAGSYEWAECNSIAEKWATDPLREELAKAAAKEIADKDALDRALVNRAKEEQK